MSRTNRQSLSACVIPAALFTAACLWLCAPAAASAQIRVSMPTLASDAGQWIVLPVTTTDLPSDPPVSSYQFTASYDPAILKITEALTSGTLSEGMSVLCNTSTPGQVTVVAAGAEPLSGGGTLLELRVRVLGTGSSPLSWSGFMFNEGTPGTLTTDGSVTLSQAAATFLAVGLPQISAQVGDTLDVPISVAEATGKEVFSYQFALVFDPAIVRIIAAVGGTGTVSEGMSLQSNSSVPGRFSVAAAAGVQLQGAGTLLTLRVRTMGVGASALQWSSFVFNEGMPIAQTNDGAASVGGTSSVQVALPQLSAEVGDTVVVPISVADLEGKGVMSYRLDLSFDPGVLSCVGLIADPSTLSAGMTVASNRLLPGRVTVAAAGSDTRSGAGDLLRLKLKCLRTGSTGLHWEGFTFNEGNPLADLVDGSVAVHERPEERVEFSLPALGTQVGDTLSVALSMSQPPQTGVSSYCLALTFDPLLVRLLGVIGGETTLSAGMALQVNRSEPGTVTVAAAAASPLVEGGTLLEFRMLALKPGASSLSLESVDLDEGWPFVRVFDGRITIAGRLPVAVSLGEPSTPLGNLLDVPVIVGDLTGSGVSAYEFSLEYDPETLRLRGVRPGAMGGASDMTLQFNGELPGELTVTAAGGTTLRGVGELAVLEMEAIGVGVAPLRWRRFILNEGDPPAAPVDGQVTVSGVQVAPAAPLLFSPADGSMNVQLVVPLRWNPSGGASSYRIQASPDSTFSTPPVDDALTSGLFREVRLPEKSTRYFWRVKALNDAGESGWSRVASLTTGSHANSPPVARVLFPTLSPAGQSVTVTTNEDTDLMLALGGADADGDALNVTITALPAKGSLYESPDGLTRGAAIASVPAQFAETGKRIVFAPARDEYGNAYASLGFMVSDGQATSAEVFVTVNVLSVNDAPVAADDAVNTAQNVPVTIEVLRNDTDADGDPLAVTAVNQGARGVVTISAGKDRVTYTPAAGYAGIDTFRYTISDGKGLTSSTIVSVRVTADVVLSLSQGYNLIALPVRPPAELTSYMLMGMVQGAAKLVRWLGGFQIYESCFATPSGALLGPDFAVAPGEGFFVRVQSPTTVAIGGTPVEAPIDLQLRPGLNLVSVPDSISRLTASTMLLRLPGDDVALTRFNPHVQQFESVARTGGNLLIPQQIGDFSIGRADGYFVRVPAGTIWNPHQTNAPQKQAGDARATGRLDGGVVLAPAGARRVGSDELNGDPTDVLDGMPSLDRPVVSDLTSAGTALCWVTSSPELGRIRYRAEGQTEWLHAIETCEREAHRLVLSDLQPETRYYCQITANGETAEATFITGHPGIGVTRTVWGRVLQEDGRTPAAEALIVLRVAGPEGAASSLLSAVTDNDGIWVANLGNLKDPISGEAFAYKTGQTVDVVAAAPGGRTGSSSTLLTGQDPERIDGSRLAPLPQPDEAPGENSVPLAFRLEQNVPNPFNANTVVTYGMPGRAHVVLRVHDAAGHCVRTLVDRIQEAGNHHVAWDGRDAGGRDVGSGVYILRFSARPYASLGANHNAMGSIAVRKLALVR